jgi:UDP-glucose 4-epimerase
LRIGITGSHGFIGSNLSNDLLQSGLQRDAVEGFDRGKFDLFDISSLKAFVEDKDVIVHLAGANRTCANDLVRVNTQGTLNLLEAIRKYNVANHIRFIFASSLQVYGFCSSLKFLKESHPTKAKTMYGLSKKFAEDIVEKYKDEYGLRALTLRIASVYGQRCKPFYNSVISTFIYQALKDLPITIYGAGRSSRDFIYVKDLTNIILEAMRLKIKTATVNICTGIPVNVGDLAKKIAEIIGKKLSITRNEEMQDNFLVGDPSLCRRLFDFARPTVLEDGLKQTIQWFRDNSNVSNVSKPI